MAALPPPPLSPSPPLITTCLFGPPGVCIQPWHIITASSSFLVAVFCCCAVLVLCKCWRPCGGPNGALGESRASQAVGSVTAKHVTLTRQGTSALSRTMTMPMHKNGRLGLERNPSEDSTGALPEGWQTYEDGDGHRYFFNLLTREMSWTMPSAAGGGSGLKRHMSRGGSSGSSLQSLTRGGSSQISTGAICIDHQVSGGAVGLDGGGGGAGAGTLPAGWSEMRDEESGCVYYWHAATAQASWVVPPAAHMSDWS